MISMNTFSESIMKNGFIVEDYMKISSSLEGDEKKFFIMIDNKKYLVKDSFYDKRRKENTLSPYCEYVGSNFIRESGLLSCQKCYLGYYKGNPVVICEDIFEDCLFRPFKELHQSSAGTDLGSKEYTYDDVLYILDKKSQLDGSDLKDYMHYFWLMFLFDAVLGNRDRHEGNWGFIKRNGITKFAPIYDNGNSLFPNVDLSNWKQYDFIKERVYIRPASQFKMWKKEYTDRAVRTNFNEVLLDSFSHTAEQIALMKTLDYKTLITKSIKDVPTEYVEWFSTIIEFRFRCLILREDFDKVYNEVMI